MPDELKEGDEVVLKGKVTEVSIEDNFTVIEVKLENGRFLLLPPCYVYKVRPGTYEVTARDIVDVFNAIAEEDWDELLLEAYLNCEIAEQNVEEMERIIDTRLRELKRKRKP